MYHTAFPDLKATLDDIFAGGDRVALPLERERHPPGRVVGHPPDRSPLYDERDHHLPDRRGQGGGRLEQHRGEPHGGRTAVVDRRRRTAKEEWRTIPATERDPSPPFWDVLTRNLTWRLRVAEARERERIEQELRVARRIQQDSCPRRCPNLRVGR